MRKLTTSLAALALVVAAATAASADGRGRLGDSGNVDAGASSGGSSSPPKSGTGGGSGGTTPGGGIVNSDGCTSGDYTAVECGAVFVPDAPTPPAVDIAQRAFDSKKLPAPKIRMNPEAPNPAYVGLKTWLWVEGGAWGDVKAEAKAGDAKVTTTATPVSIVWDMGEKRVVCQGPGKPWRKGLGSGADTTCGYTFKHTSKRQPGGKINVRVYYTYDVSWTCKGDDCDEETDGNLGTVASPATTAAIVVKDREPVVVR